MYDRHSVSATKDVGRGENPTYDEHRIKPQFFFIKDFLLVSKIPITL